MSFISSVDFMGEYISRIYDLIRLIEELNELPMLFQNIGLALLTILVPLAIAILADFYQKRGDKTLILLNWISK